MKSFMLPLVILLTSFLSTVSAFGQRGTAERMLYWVAYLSEEEIRALDSTYEYTVAPGCIGGGERANGRCNLDELLIYIWASNEAKGDITRPTKMTIPTRVTDKIDISFDRFFGYISNSQFDTGFKPDGLTDSSRLMPNVGDYYDVLQNMGNPIRMLSDAVDASGMKASALAYKYWKLGKDSAFLVTALRRGDMDSYRASSMISYFSRNVPEGLTTSFEPVMTNIDTLMTQKADGSSKRVPKTITAIDFDATITKYIDEVPDIVARLTAANQNYMRTNPINPNHNVGVEAARAATVACNCERKYPRNLKKRNLTKKLNDRKRLGSRKLKKRKYITMEM